MTVSSPAAREPSPAMTGNDLKAMIYGYVRLLCQVLYVMVCGAMSKWRVMLKI